MSNTYAWPNAQTLESKRYICSYCDQTLSSNQGYLAQEHNGRKIRFLYICHDCGKPTFFDENRNQHPGTPFGQKVLHVDSEHIEKLYDEARNSMQVNAYTASAMCSRKLLMNIAVVKKAKKGLSYAEYVDYLEKKNFIPPDGKDCVDYIRKRGNQANHEIEIISRKDAELLISFVEMLLKYIYEYPGKYEAVNPKKNKSEGNPSNNLLNNDEEAKD